MNVVDRISAFRARMEEENMAAVIVPTADSHASEYLAEHFKTRKWLCGFTGSACTLVIEQSPLDAAFLIFVEAELDSVDVHVQSIGDIAIGHTLCFVKQCFGTIYDLGLYGSLTGKGLEILSVFTC